MQVRGARSPSHRAAGTQPLMALLIVGTLALAGCGQAARPKTASSTDCGTTRTAANVPVEVAVDQGQVSCTVALTVEHDYARAIVAGKVQGNGGGAPVLVDGWKCQGYPTPELLKTGKASKCVKAGAEILAILKTPA